MTKRKNVFLMTDLGLRRRGILACKGMSKYRSCLRDEKATHTSRQSFAIVTDLRNNKKRGGTFCPFHH